MPIVPETYNYCCCELNDDNKKEEYAVIKGAIPKDIKYRFKVVCIQKELEMSTVLEELIQEWVQKKSPIVESYVNFAKDELEDVKGYISKSLKLQFKIICAQKKVKMRSVLYYLINQWLQSVEPMFEPSDG
ncbi:MAG: hypothetical protein NHB32_16860 [Fischerella sp. CENA71]|nr:hypothetical protein [Fischerella sp. CENA71]